MKTLINLPEAISKRIIEEVDCSLNVLYPKMFYEINVREKLIEIVVPGTDDIIEDLSKLIKVIIGPSAKATMEVYTIVFPLIRKSCQLSYNKREKTVKDMYTVNERDFQKRRFRTISVEGE